MNIKKRLKLFARVSYDKYLMSLSDEQKIRKVQVWYEKKMGQPLDLDHPRTFNEKIQWLKLFDATPIKTRLANKYAVRAWISERLGDNYLIPLLGVYNKFDDIDFSSLPTQFVMKANHASGWNIIVNDKSSLDITDARDKFDVWMKMNFACRMGFELQYMNIEPKIVIEEYMADLEGDIFDFRFFCFNGKPQFVWVDIGSGTSHHKRNIYDVDWNLQEYKVNYPNLDENMKKPDTYDEMLRCAKVLCEGFSFVRVDFYSVKGKVLFGEMTFTPQSGTGQWDSEGQNILYGSLINLSEKRKDLPKPRR